MKCLVYLPCSHYKWDNSMRLIFPKSTKLVWNRKRFIPVYRLQKYFHYSPLNLVHKNIWLNTNYLKTHFFSFLSAPTSTKLADLSPLFEKLRNFKCLNAFEQIFLINFCNFKTLAKGVYNFILGQLLLESLYWKFYRRDLKVIKTFASVFNYRTQLHFKL